MICPFKNIYFIYSFSRNFILIFWWTPLHVIKKGNICMYVCMYIHILVLYFVHIYDDSIFPCLLWLMDLLHVCTMYCSTWTASALIQMFLIFLSFWKIFSLLLLCWKFQKIQPKQKSPLGDPKRKIQCDSYEGLLCKRCASGAD